jgi:peptide deformylase
MIKPILLLGNPTLRMKCRRVEHFGTPVLRSLIDDLRDTLYDFRQRNGFGRGIAAPQIGRTERVIFIHVDQPLALVNPVIVKRSKRTFTLWDDCFSFPDLVVKVRRHQAIEVSYTTDDGERRTLKGVGPLSELLQHEIDHLNGILAIDRAVDSKAIILRAEWEKWKKERSL